MQDRVEVWGEAYQSLSWAPIIELLNADQQPPARTDKVRVPLLAEGFAGLLFWLWCFGEGGDILLSLKWIWVVQWYNGLPLLTFSTVVHRWMLTLISKNVRKTNYRNAWYTWQCSPYAPHVRV